MFKIESASEQVASHLRKELQKGQWVKVMPGRSRLAKLLGVDGNTVERAMQQLEAEGLLQSQGAGKPRLITLAKKGDHKRRVLIIPYEMEDVSRDYIVRELCSNLHLKGYEVIFATNSLTDLKHDPDRVKEMLKSYPEEACITIAASKPILELLSNMDQPSFSLYGQLAKIPIAGTGADKSQAFCDAINWLCENGHERIVMLAKSETLNHGLSKPQIGFLESLSHHNLPSSKYNLPEWDNTPKGLHDCLTSLFQITPPTAIFIDDWMLHYAIQNFLIRQNDAACRNIVCISTDYHPCFKWCHIGVPHFYWDPMQVIRHIVRWVDSVESGKESKKQAMIKARFIGVKR